MQKDMRLRNLVLFLSRWSTPDNTSVLRSNAGKTQQQSRLQQPSAISPPSNINHGGRAKSGEKVLIVSTRPFKLHKTIQILQGKDATRVVTLKEPCKMSSFLLSSTLLCAFLDLRS